MDHISFASSHPPPNNRPFESFVSVSNPSDESQSHSIPIWPSHCVQGTQGAKIIPEIDASKLDTVVEKGRDKRLEMFSVFADVFGGKSSKAASLDIASLLRTAGITDVIVVGLAGDYCVKCTALDARKEGFKTFVVEDAVKSVDPSAKGWGAAKQDLKDAAIHIVSMGGPEVTKIRSLARQIACNPTMVHL